MRVCAVLWLNSPSLGERPCDSKGKTSFEILDGAVIQGTKDG